MNSNEVSALILEEIKTERYLANVQGLDVTACLMEPLKELDFLDNAEQLELLTVLKKRKMDCNIGYYGTFLETLYSM